MPELPEVETITIGLKPYLENKIIQDVIVRNHKLRWPIPDNLPQILSNQKILQLSRRGKYLLVLFDHGTLIVHLGMSGSLCIVPINTPLKKHDHIDLIFSDDYLLRYNDPRRFGSFLWANVNFETHLLLKSLGPEPLSSDFNVKYLHNCAKNRKKAIKNFIMDNNVVVGVGNIYATEALFAAQIHPSLKAGCLSFSEHERLVKSIKKILQIAISKGGTTLRDYVNSEGKPGYFSQKLNVYGRGNRPCKSCNTILQIIKIGQRSTVFCETCQPYR